VEDVAEGFVALLDSKVEGDVNIASGEPRSVASVLEALARIIGRPELIQLGARPKAPNDPPRLVAAVERLRSEAGVKFPRSVDERLADTVQWWRSQATAK